LIFSRYFFGFLFGSRCENGGNRKEEIADDDLWCGDGKSFISCEAHELSWMFSADHKNIKQQQLRRYAKRFNHAMNFNGKR
jgi:hypothetical protein